MYVPRSSVRCCCACRSPSISGRPGLVLEESALSKLNGFHGPMARSKRRYDQRPVDQTLCSREVQLSGSLVAAVPRGLKERVERIDP